MKRKINDNVEFESQSKDWRHAFLEAEIINEDMMCNDGTNRIEIVRCDNCDEYSLLCAYVGQFEKGGFWFNSRDGLHFVIIKEIEATYEDAKLFLKQRKG